MTRSGTLSDEKKNSRAVLRPDVKLHPLSQRHASATYRWTTDPTVGLNIGLRETPSRTKTRLWIARALLDETIEPFAVTLLNRHVGNLVLDQIDHFLGTARLSVYIGDHESRAQGVGFTAVYRGLAYSFLRLKLYKVCLTAHTENIVAINLYQKLGFAVEGILRGEFMIRDRRLNVLRMSLLKTEFDSLTNHTSGVVKTAGESRRH